MPLAYEQVEMEALQLNRNERIILGQELLASALLQEETDIEKAWYDEAEHRLAAYKAGTLKTVPGEHVINTLIAKLS